MRTKRKKWLRALYYCTLLFLCSAAGDIIGYSSLGRWAELRTYDLRFKCRGPLPKSAAAPVTILALDEEALSAVPDPLMLWHGAFAQVVDRLVQQRAGVIGVDFIFSDISKFDPEGQRALGESLLKAGEAGVPVVLAYAIRSSGVEQPNPTLRMTALAAGHTLAYANLTTDSDDFVRRQQILAIGEDKQMEFGFALAIATRYSEKHGRPFAVTDSDPRTILVNFRGPDQFPRISFAKAVEAARKGNEAFFKDHFQDRIVLIGRVGGLGDEDLHSTPQYFWQDRGGKIETVRTPGVEIHAHVIATLLEKNNIRQLTPSRQRATVFLLCLLVAIICFRLSPTAAPILSLLLMTGYVVAAFLWWFPAGWWLPVVSPVSGALLTVGTAGILDFIVEGREKRRLRNLFKRYVDDKVIEKIMQSPEALVLQGERKMVTLLFADIRNFTTRSESAPAQAIVRDLNEYFTAIVPVIQKHQGMVDKYIGDGIMAVFGAPVDDPDAAFHGVQAALGMVTALREVNARLARRGAAPIAIGIGVHTGEAVVGNIGSPEKIDYTAIGDAVNLASRIEGLTRRFDADILISGETYAALQGRIPATLLGEEAVKGRTQPVPVYAVPAPGS